MAPRIDRHGFQLCCCYFESRSRPCGKDKARIGWKARTGGQGRQNKFGSFRIDETKGISVSEFCLISIEVDISEHSVFLGIPPHYQTRWPHCLEKLSVSIFVMALNSSEFEFGFSLLGQ